MTMPTNECAARRCTTLVARSEEWAARVGAAKLYCREHACPMPLCPGRREQPTPGNPTGLCGRHRCKVDGCDEEFYAKDYCSKHWKRWRRHGDPLVVGKPGRPPAPVRPDWEAAPGWSDLSPRSRARLTRAGRTLVRLGGWEQALLGATRPGGTVNVTAVERAADEAREAARARRAWSLRAAQADAQLRSVREC